MATYANVRNDFEILERIAELDDQVELDAARIELMRDPTKRKAIEMYLRAINLWFDQNQGVYGSHPDAASIARRYHR